MYNLADISGVHTMFELIPNHLVIKNKHGMHGKHVYICQLSTQNKLYSALRLKSLRISSFVLV